MLSNIVNTKRLVVVLLAGAFIVACVSPEKTAPSKKIGPEVLYIYPDGKMEFRGRFMNEDEVVIYEDGFGGERAAVLLRVPYKEDIYRDTIIVERKGVPVKRLEEN